MKNRPRSFARTYAHCQWLWRSADKLIGVWIPLEVMQKLFNEDCNANNYYNTPYHPSIVTERKCALVITLIFIVQLLN